MTELTGKGLLSDRLWVVEGGRPDVLARRVSQLGLGFLLIRLAHGDLTLVPEASRSRFAEALALIRERGVSVWGIGALAGPTQANVDLAVEMAAAFLLDGWIVEPVESIAEDRIAPTLESLQARLPRLRLGILGSWSGDPRGLAAVETSPRTSVHLFTRLSSAGSVGIAQLAAPDRRRWVPILDCRASTQTSDASGKRSPKSGWNVSAFIAAATELGTAGVALAAWDSLETTPAGLRALAALSASPWPEWLDDRDTSPSP